MYMYVKMLKNLKKKELKKNRLDLVLDIYVTDFYLVPTLTMCLHNDVQS